MRIAVSVLPALLCILAGCGGGDGGNAMAAPCLSFSAAQAPAPGRVVARPAAGGSCAAQSLEIVVTDVSDVYGAQLTVTFDPTRVSYGGVSSQGTFLTEGGVQVSLQQSGAGSGTVTVGITRLAASTGVDVTGSRVLVRLTFVPVAAGSTALSLSHAELFGSETPPQTKPGLTWSGGTFTIQ